MSDRARRRVDELIAELVELVETARTVPMSGSCVVPREHTLDLLDDLRESVPPELVEARDVLAQREALIAEANEVHRQAAERAAAEAEALLAAARQEASELIADAEVQAHQTVEAGHAEHAELVSASRVHQTASEQAARTRADADEYDAARRNQADRYAAALRTDAESFADQTLADLVGVLRQAMTTAEKGRQALAQRRAEETGGAPDEAPDGAAADGADRSITG
jgi:cell division septum initiation protein DivIVA